MYPQLGKHFGILGLLGFQQKEQVQKGFKRVVYQKKTKVQIENFDQELSGYERP